MKKNLKLSGLCAWCERPIKTAVQAEGKQYCQRLCAAQGLLDAEVAENNISDDHGALTALFVKTMIYEGPKYYAVKVRDCDAEDYDHADDRDGFYPICVVIEDDQTPDWVPDPLVIDPFRYVAAI
jgi:hypothetical protein